MYMKKSGGPEQKGILRRAVSSLLALIGAVQHNLLWDPFGFLCMMYNPQQEYSHAGFHEL